MAAQPCLCWTWLKPKDRFSCDEDDFLVDVPITMVSVQSRFTARK